MSLEYYHPDAIVHLINDTDPFEKYTNGDVITHSSEKIGDVTYLGSDYKKGYVEVETKDGRVVKYNMEKFLGKNYQEAPLDNVSKIEEKIDTTAEQVEPIDTTLFEEFDAINKSLSISERAAKRKEFEANHGEMAAKIKDITTNFDTYIKQLKDEGVIKNVDCE
ncbi:MAG: hypothetical protein IPP69_17750 [Flavobacteriales bacterium]|nr:hypothetical protein [Flavobacteriales bacterium]